MVEQVPHVRVRVRKVRLRHRIVHGHGTTAEQADQPALLGPFREPTQPHHGLEKPLPSSPHLSSVPRFRVEAEETETGGFELRV